MEIIATFFPYFLALIAGVFYLALKGASYQ
jgi:hypothetical protein